jgi:hypothetical protein
VGPFLFLVGAAGVVIALIALIRGRLGWAYLEGRKPAAWTLIGAFLVFSVGAALTPQPATRSTAARKFVPPPATSAPPASTAAPTTTSPMPAAASPTTPSAPGPVPSTSSPRAVTRAAGGVVLPDRRSTPGAVYAGVTTTEVCVPGWSGAHHSVSDSLRQQIFASYGVPWSRHSDYRVDHLIPLELGGSNSARNLWPEPEVAATAGSASKDRLENHLHDLVCAGTVSLRTAQRAVSVDWYTAYRHYMSISTTSSTPVPEPRTPSTSPPPPGGGATAQCNDGTVSYAAHHQGACSHHGGVRFFYH